MVRALRDRPSPRRRRRGRRYAGGSRSLVALVAGFGEAIESHLSIDLEGLQRLGFIVERYGSAVEADLAFRNVDLEELWRSHRWRKLLNLIEHLPRDSYYLEALASDKEIAERMAGREPEPFSYGFHEWGASQELLAGVHEQLQAIRAVLVAVNNGKPGPVIRWPRPRGALADVKQRQRFERHHALMRRLGVER